MATASELLSAASLAISSYLASRGEPARGPIRCREAKSLGHGDIYALDREIAAAVERTLDRENLSLDDFLRSVNASHRPYFQRVTFGPQGHLYLSLNRTLILANCLHEVTCLREKYGSGGQPVSKGPIVLLNHSIAPLQAGTLKPHARETDLQQARTTVLIGLLSKLKESSGHRVESVNSFPPELELSPQALRLLQSSAESPTTAGDNGLSENDFLNAMAKSSYLVETMRGECIAGTTADSGREQLPGAAAVTEDVLRKSMTIDAGRLLRDKTLSGKGGYDGNIRQVTVTDVEGRLTAVGAMAYEMCRLCQRCAGHRGGRGSLVNITQQRMSFVVQQAMVVAESVQTGSTSTVTASHASWRAHTQHLLQVADVQCSIDGHPVKQCTLDQLMAARLQQVTDACTVRYRDEMTEGSQLKSIAQRITDAVVKFDFLSTDPNSKVKIELPSTGGRTDDDVRSSGAFVLYNYARLSSLFAHYSRACEKGVYPPLPDIKAVDFSLLSDEEEWQLMFHYVLQYPSIVGEAAELKAVGTGIHVTVGAKKICQFLTKLSHAFSSYYSRVKVLVSPEPHLVPVIHARLYLMSAIKQVIHNALSLLSVEPLEEL